MAKQTGNRNRAEAVKRGWQTRHAQRNAVRRRLGLPDGEKLTSVKIYKSDLDALHKFGKTVPLAIHALLLGSERLFWEWREDFGCGVPTLRPSPDFRLEGKSGGKRVYRYSPGIVLHPPKMRPGWRRVPLAGEEAAK